MPNAVYKCSFAFSQLLGSFLYKPLKIKIQLFKQPRLAMQVGKDAYFGPENFRDTGTAI